MILRSILLLALGSWAHADLIVVDQGGAGDFTSLQDAVDAAVAGDVIRVFPGEYGLQTPVVLNKAVRLIGDGPDAVQVGREAVCIDTGSEWSCDPLVERPGLIVTGLAAGELALVSGMTVRGAVLKPGGKTGVIQVLDNDGLVVLHDVQVAKYQSKSGDSPVSPVFMGKALQVRNSELVLVSASELHGQDGVCESGLTVFSGDAVHVSAGSRLWVTDSRLEGGEAHGCSGGKGSAGMILNDSVLYTADSSLSGGAGAAIPNLCWGSSGWYVCGYTFYPGGDGLAAKSSVIKTVASSDLSAGNHKANALELTGTSTAFVGPDVVVDELHPSIADSSQRIDLDFVSAWISAESPSVAPGGDWQLVFHGTPGDVALLYFGDSLTTGVGHPSMDGVFALPLDSFAYLGQAAFDADGRATFDFEIAPLPELSGASAFAQGLAVGAEYLGFTNPLPLVVK